MPNDTLAAPWTPLPRSGMYQKSMRGDREAGTFLGMPGFDPLTGPGCISTRRPR